MAEYVEKIGVQGAHVRYWYYMWEKIDHLSDEGVLLFAGQRQYFYMFAIFKVRTLLSSSNSIFFNVFMTLKLAVTFEYIQNNPCLRVLSDLT